MLNGFKVFFLIGLFLCSGVHAKETLKVLLYSHIPTGNSSKEFNTIKKRMKSEFEAQHPEIEIIIDMDPIKLDTYNVLNKEESEKGMISEIGYDIIEVDTLYLEKLVRKGLVSEIKLANKKKYIKSSITSVTFDQKTYGVPTMMCSYYLAHHKSLEKPSSLMGSTKVSGMYSDSMVLSLVYSALFSQLNHGRVVDFSKKTDDVVLDKMSQIIKKCIDYKCTTKDYFFSKELAKTLGPMNSKKHSIAIAYSQILHYLKQTDSKYKLSPFQVNEKTYPIFSLTNSLVINKKRCQSLACKRKVQKFLNYYSSKETLSWISLNQDNPSYPARYISPSLESFYTMDNVANDKDYQTIYTNLNRAQSISYKDLLDFRKERTFEIIDFLIKLDPKFKPMKKLDLWVKDL